MSPPSAALQSSILAAKIASIPRLLALGLNFEQIAQALVVGRVR